MPKHIQPLLGLHNLTLAAWACCKRRQRVLGGEMSLNYRDGDQYRYYSASVQLFRGKPRFIPMSRTKKYSSVESFSGDQTYR